MVKIRVRVKTLLEYLIYNLHWLTFECIMQEPIRKSNVLKIDPQELVKIDPSIIKWTDANDSWSSVSPSLFKLSKVN